MVSSEGESAGLAAFPWKSAYGPGDQPLASFYIPALSRSVRYDRIAGFFSSYALAVAAQGVASLISRGGRMRLLVGAQLDERDVEAVLRGISLQDRLAERFLPLLQNPEALAESLLRERLKVLAWLVANDRLDIRVVVEADPVTRQVMASGGYFHAKGGVLWDEQGDGVAFSGSINETATAWQTNYERFHVFCSWREPEHFRQEAGTFERLWKNAEAGWLTVDLPEAIQKELVRLAPVEPPIHEPAFTEVAKADEQARWLAQFLRDAPYLVHKGWRVGVETAAVRPFPHQRKVAYDFLDNFPTRRLLADEVGLGKTIEAGLILRSLVLSGWVKRCLILVPRSLAKQWQEELRDRFLVNAPFYDGSRFVYFRHPENEYKDVPPGRSPWEVHQVVIASAQMVKREGRMDALLNAPPWDLVIVDEAHHARRRDFLDLGRYRPNRLLSLLEKLNERTKAMLLMTATPMQVHAIEVWDLLRLVGLPGHWKEGQEAFLMYFDQMRLPFEDVSWDVVLPMVRDAVKYWGWDRGWEQATRDRVGSVGLHRLRHVIEHGERREALQLAPDERRCLVQTLRRHCPVQYLIQRHTRALLRDYYARGISEYRVPNRRPEPVWLEMSEQEENLYRDIESYISTYYKRYEEERKGLGFVMTVYRRRLTSSLYALRESLERHKQDLLGQWTDVERPGGLDDEDLEEADLTLDQAEEIAVRPRFADEEVREVDRLLAILRDVSTETKLNALRQHLQEALLKYDQVLVFTQYTDTMDFLRRELLPTFGSKLACYSGRGGERWDNTSRSWLGVSKERLQKDFADPDSEARISVLLCTEAAGEGLNLQNCGVLFNYDMPWNPMKVEQRIGRVDRIGQQRSEVFIRHYFYKGTVEADVYRALGERITWFEDVVGELQPILQAAQSTIQRLAMASPDEREAAMRDELTALEREYDKRSRETTPTSAWEPREDPEATDAPVSLTDLEGALSNLPTWDRLMRPTERSKTYSVTLGSEHQTVTTDPDAAGATDAGEAARLLTYGEDVLNGLLALPAPAQRNDLVRLLASSGTSMCGYYAYAGPERWQPIQSATQLVRYLERPGRDMPECAEAAWNAFRSDVKAIRSGVDTLG